MGALLEQRLSDTDLRRILLTFAKYNNEYCYTGADYDIDGFIMKFENGEITFIELEDDDL